MVTVDKYYDILIAKSPYTRCQHPFIAFQISRILGSDYRLRSLPKKKKKTIGFVSEFRMEGPDKAPPLNIWDD